MTQTPPPSLTELLTFQLADQDYALDIMSVREIRGWTRSTPLPHAPSYMCGVINLRGTVLPVMDLANRLGLPTAARSDRNVIIVVHQGDTMTGLLVDSVSDIVTLSTEELQPPPEMTPDKAPCVIAALTLIEERMVRVLDLDATVSVPEGAAA